ncbi:reductive dehalogenase [Dehalogenimonas lykanthroporepellens BL-DC-9]|jgi:reductive dehalogenase|nr:reductive dehalogenase [Dehalogenimonas lykanthroporepellens BL-DC-9]
MSTFHSTISRRDFMKGLGLAGAGLGAATAISPPVQDLEELAAIGDYQKPDMPWWVKQRDLYDPTAEIDWDVIKPFPGRVRMSPGDPLYMDPYSTENGRKYVEAMNKRDPTFDWLDPRRAALDAAARERGGALGASLAGPPVTMTPEEQGYPKWNGTLEENFKLLRGAVRFLGGSDVGVVERDDKCLKIADADWATESGISEPYQKADGTKVTPSSYNWGFVWTMRQAQDLTLRQGGGAGRADAEAGNPLGIAESAAVWMAYTHLAIVERRIQVFLRGIGYRGAPGFGLRGAIGSVTGMIEHARMGSVGVHPLYGATIRGLYNMYTDLPLPPTNPIDAGLMRFCETCGLCADTCPGGLIETGPSSWETPRPDFRAGYKGWRTTIANCPHCPQCQATCPFNSAEKTSFIHDAIRLTVSTAPVFNSFFADMDHAMGYGKLPQEGYWETWWKQPTHGYDTYR